MKLIIQMEKQLMNTFGDLTIVASKNSSPDDFDFLVGKLKIIKKSQNLKVIELRNYLIKPRMRDRFIDYFENHFLDSQEELGGYETARRKIEKSKH